MTGRLAWPALPGVRPLRALDLVLAALALASAALVKGACSRAGADELGFLLAPTAWLVERVTGHAFERELGAGYLSREAGLVIAPVCAGVNFLVVAFVSLVVGFSRRHRRVSTAALWLVASGALSYGATLFVNAMRIASWLAFGQRLAAVLGLSPHELHRALGVCVYLAGLLLLYAFADRCLRRGAPVRAAIGWPLALYVGATLVVPVLRGVASGPVYARHALVVLSGVLVVLVLSGLSRRLVPAWSRAEQPRR